MNVRNWNKMRSAYVPLLLNLIYVAVAVLFFLLALALEVPTNRDGIYVLFSMFYIILLIFYPLYATVFNGISLYFQISDLRSGEARVKSIIILSVTVIYEIAVLLFSFSFWDGLSYA